MNEVFGFGQKIAIVNSTNEKNFFNRNDLWCVPRRYKLDIYEYLLYSMEMWKLKITLMHPF